jgi:C-terminal processing protease CtpA/Prc
MKRLMYIFVLMCLLSSCERVLLENDMASSDPLVNFDYLWNQVDKKYSYFGLKEIDWDSIRQAYRAQISADMTEEQLFSVLAAMLNELRDDHSNLISPFNVSRYDVALNYPSNYRKRTIDEFYIPQARITGAFSHEKLLGHDIAYVRYSSFMSTVDNASLDHILSRYKDTKGLILDLRANGGGSVANTPLILERFVTQRTLGAYSITRNGPGRADFGEREPFFINVFDGVKFSKPVAVLTDRGSYSATSFFATITKALPNVILIGDTTGGGGGLPNGGQLPNGWTFRISVSQLLDLAGNNYAEQGVPPEIIATFDWSDLSKDEIIERAIEYLEQ